MVLLVVSADRIVDKCRDWRNPMDYCKIALWMDRVSKSLKTRHELYCF